MNTSWVNIYIFPQILKKNVNKLLNLAYRNQPAIFKEGANSAFHEGLVLKLLIFIKKHTKIILIHKKAVGDSIALSVLSWKHLENIKLLKSGTVTKGFFTFLTFNIF